LKNSQMQGDLFTNLENGNQGDYLALETALKGLPPLPPRIRYYSDYFDDFFSMNALNENGTWLLEIPEKYKRTLRFERFDPVIQPFLKAWVVWALSKLSPITVRSYFYSFECEKSLIPEIMEQMIQNPIDGKVYWEDQLLACGLSHHTYCALKSLLSSFCDYGIGGWTPDLINFLGTFPLPKKADPYAAVRSGSAFLGSEEQSCIVAHFDELNERIANHRASEISDKDLQTASILYWAYAHGVRPIQIANRNLSDLRIWASSDEPPVIHLRFQYAKQRSRGRDKVQTRTMKRDWTLMMEEFVRRRLKEPIRFVSEEKRENSLFCLSPIAIGRRLKSILKELTGIDRQAYDLRHTAAQRNVDAGMASVELAEFLMHSYIDTNQVYYDTSATQADRVNKALGLSPIYSELAEVAKTRKIDKAKLLGLAPDQQIGAAPHGYPIVGIGGCDLGQSLCSKNPSLSCYTCPKFMALGDIEIHVAARDTMQTIVKEFVGVGKEDMNQPAFMQLRSALEGVSAVIAEISSDGGGGDDDARL